MAPYTPRERYALVAIALVTGLGLNGSFLYGAIHPDTVLEALGNPIAVAFVLEAVLLVGLLAYLLERSQMTRLGWPWLVGLSMLGGLAFALPIVLLWNGRVVDAAAAAPKTGSYREG
jgi:hypothetical protein